MTENAPETGPGLLQQAANFGKAIVRHAVDGGRHVSDDVYLARLAVCADCPSFDAEKTSCKQRTCGCRVQIKARWRSEECPLQKWPSPEGV